MKMQKKGFTRRGFIKNIVALGTTLSLGFSFLKPKTARAQTIRPPGALKEEEFLARCIRCGRCGDACRNRAISSLTKKNGAIFSITPGKGEMGTPVIFPRQKACNLCQTEKGDQLLCTEACPTGALQVIAKKPEEIQKNVSMGKAVVDRNLCYSFNGSSCGVCVRACPFEGKALKAGIFEKPLVNLDYCVGCGLCERACIRYPQAITVNPGVNT